MLKLKLNMNVKRKYLAWIDCETTGLNVDTDQILEIALIVTDSTNLVEYERYHSPLLQTLNVINGMGEWCKKVHSQCTSLGPPLTTLCMNAKIAKTIEQVSDDLCAILDRWRENAFIRLAGSSVHCDRAFIKKWLPKVDSRLHYRHVDVSSIMECDIDWRLQKKHAKPKNNTEHRAIKDIESSIALLNYYRNEITNRFNMTSRLSYSQVVHKNFQLPQSLSYAAPIFIAKKIHKHSIL